MSVRSELDAVLDVALTSPVAARDGTGRWSPATATAYLAVAREAREWWDKRRREALQAANTAGIEMPGSRPTFMPWPPDRLAEYVAHLCEQGRAPATVRKAMSAIRAVHRAYGFPLPDGLAALAVLRRHELTLTEAGWEPRRARPVDVADAVRLLAAVDRSTVRGRMDAAVLLLAMGGMLAPVLLAQLNLGDVADADPDGITVRRDGRPVLVAHWRIGGVHHPQVCPVEAVLALVRYLRGRDAGADTPLLRAVDQWGNVAGLDAFAGPANPDGRLEPRAFGVIVRRVADRAGVPADLQPTMTDLRLGGIVRRRLDGATVDELAAESGVVTLLGHIAAAERRTGGQPTTP